MHAAKFAKNFIIVKVAGERWEGWKTWEYMAKLISSFFHLAQWTRHNNRKINSLRRRLQNNNHSRGVHGCSWLFENKLLPLEWGGGSRRCHVERKKAHGILLIIHAHFSQHFTATTVALSHLFFNVIPGTLIFTGIIYYTSRYKQQWINQEIVLSAELQQTHPWANTRTRNSPHRFKRSQLDCRDALLALN